MGMSNEEYAAFVDSLSPRSPIWGDLLRAGLVGGAICVVGQALVNLYEHWGASAATAATWCSITLVFLGALLLGPVDGLAIGGVGTLLYQLLRFGVSATTALWIAPYVLLGLCVGAVSARHGYACTPRQLALLAVLGELGITVLNTGSLYVDSLIYGYYSPVFVFGTLPLRLAICAGKGIVLALLLPTLLRITRRALQPRAN